MEADIKFEREQRIGIIPVGTYLFDAAKRFGVKLETELFGEWEDAVVNVSRGQEFLSDYTSLEKEHLTEASRKKGERLARQAKIEKSGEVVIMTKEKIQEEPEEEQKRQEEYRKKFQELPLEKKIAELVELERIALSDTFSFVLNSPYKIGEKIIDVLAEFGLRFEEEEKKAKTPEEHKAEAKTKAEENAKNEAKSQAETAEKPKRTRKPRAKKTASE